MPTVTGFLHRMKTLADTAGQKTSTAVAVSKQKLVLVQLEDRLRSTYERIGTLVYQEQKNGLAQTSAIEACVTEVDHLQLEIEAAKETLASLRNGVCCPGCQTINPLGVPYCKRCGVSLH